MAFIHKHSSILRFESWLDLHVFFHHHLFNSANQKTPFNVSSILWRPWFSPMTNRFAAKDRIRYFHTLWRPPMTNRFAAKDRIRYFHTLWRPPMTNRFRGEGSNLSRGWINSERIHSYSAIGSDLPESLYLGPDRTTYT